MSKTVCTNWSEFEATFKKAQHLAKDCYKASDSRDLIEIIEDLSGLIHDMYDNAHDMHRGASDMEDRLRLYRSAIESLGFKRDLTSPKV